jgi:transposase InsO family protein
VDRRRRRLWITGVTAHPNGNWVTQQARNVTGDIVDEGIDVKFLVRDRDTKYVASFDQVFRSEGAQILRTPFRTPNANAYAERFVRTVRSECLDHLLVVNARISSTSFGAMPGTTTAIAHIRDYPERFLHQHCRLLCWQRRLYNLHTPTGYMFVD